MIELQLLTNEGESISIERIAYPAAIPSLSNARTLAKNNSLNAFLRPECAVSPHSTM